MIVKADQAERQGIGRFSRILLIGASGQVGSALATRFSRGTLVAASHAHGPLDHLRIDLGDPVSIRRALDDVRPDAVIVAGAMCNAEQCEREPELCERINSTGPAAVAEYARVSGAYVVFFSTDHVFDGVKETYVEDDFPNPLYVYARSKAVAEGLLRKHLPDRHLIVRTGWVYGPDAQRRNFVLRLVDRISAGETVVVPSDQWGCPTYTEDLAKATHFLLEHGEVGTFHATGPEFLDRGTLALSVCDEFGLDRAAIACRPTRQIGQVARRSLRVRLDCDKLLRTGVAPFRGVAKGLRALHAGGHPGAL